MMSRLRDIVMNAPLRIDIDNPSELKLLEIYLNLKAVFKDIKIERTRHGYHFTAKGVKSDIDLRYEFGDCSGRIYHSLLRGGDDVMFDYKGKVNRYGVKINKNETIDEMNLLCLPFVSRIPRGYYVKRRR